MIIRMTNALYDNDNIIARILRGDIPCNMVFENDSVLAFHDINKAAPVHVLVVPKKAYCSYHDFSMNASAQEQLALHQAVAHVADITQIVQSGYRIISNHGANASQIIAHFHMHVLGGRELGGLLTDDKTFR